MASRQSVHALLFFYVLAKLTCVANPQHGHKIRLSPNIEQRAILRKWFGTARMVWNDGVALSRRSDRKTWSDAFKSYRQGWRNKGLDVDRAWAKEIPGDIRDGAVLDVQKAVKSNLAKKKTTPGTCRAFFFQKGHLTSPGHKFQLHFKGRKQPSSSLYICKRNVTIHEENGKKSVILYRNSTLGKLGGIRLKGVLTQTMPWCYLLLSHPRQRQGPQPACDPSRLPTGKNSAGRVLSRCTLYRVAWKG